MGIHALQAPGCEDLFISTSASSVPSSCRWSRPPPSQPHLHSPSLHWGGLFSTLSCGVCSAIIRSFSITLMCYPRNEVSVGPSSAIVPGVKIALPARLFPWWCAIWHTRQECGRALVPPHLPSTCYGCLDPRVPGWACLLSWSLMMSSIFLCAYWTFVSFPGRNVYPGLLHIWKLSFYCWVLRVLYVMYFRSKSLVR